VLPDICIDIDSGLTTTLPSNAHELRQATITRETTNLPDLASGGARSDALTIHFAQSNRDTNPAKKNLAARRAGALLPLTLLAFSVSVAAQETDTEEKRLATVVSTGVRGAERTVAESPAPIDVISGDAVRKSGRAGLSEVLSKLLPSMNFGSNNGGLGQINRPLTNRSLAPAYTLVLVNGKRRHKTAFPASGSVDNSGANAVDLDTIPVSAVQRIEVLKDSAAAQYGSDAVAGVINVILKDASSGGHISAQTGQLFEGNGESSQIEGDTGFELGDGGFLHLSADVRKRNATTYNNKATGSNWFALPNGQPDPREASWDRDGLHNGDPELKNYNLGYNAALPISNGLELYSNGTYGEQDAVIGNNKRRANGDGNILELFPNGYFPTNDIHSEDFQALAGIRGDLGEWKWDISSSLGRNRVEHASDFTINPSLGPTSPTSFSDLGTWQNTEWTNNLDVSRGYDIGLVKPLQVSWGAELRRERFQTFAGDEIGYRNGGYIYPALQPNGNRNPLAGQPAQVGAQAATIVRPEYEVDIERKSYATYLDLGINPTEKWYVGLAGRFEHFDDSSGNTFNGKFNSRYDFTDTFAIRGTVGSGFRAPSLTQIAFTDANSLTARNPDGSIVPALNLLAPVDSDVAKALGAEDLKAEKTFNLGAGFVWRPLPSWNLTADAYQIDIKDRISRTEAIYGPALAPILTEAGLNSGYRVSYYANAFDTRTRGVDVVSDYTWRPQALGLVRWTAAFNYNKTTITGRKAAPDVLSSLGSNSGGSLTWVGRAREGDLTEATPKTKWVLGANWLINDFDINLQTTRYGKVKALQQLESGDRSFGAKWITDLDVSYALTDAITVSLGGINIFDVRPDDNAVANNTGGYIYGNPPFSPAGGFWYTKLAYDF
jgi:iron complex outermembrane receptor protein